MVKFLESVLSDLQTQYDSLLDDAGDLETGAFDESLRSLVDDQIEDRLARLAALLPDGMVSRKLAQRFVRESAWWLRHPSGPTRARGHARRVYGSGSDWRIDFGANTFLVGSAILRCAKTMTQYLNEAKEGQLSSPDNLIKRLRRNVRGAIANYDGDEYLLYPLEDNDMVFGTQSIDVQDFVSLFLEYVPPIDESALD
jgi:hypothetical protein